MKSSVISKIRQFIAGFLQKEGPTSCWACVEQPSEGCPVCQGTGVVRKYAPKTAPIGVMRHKIKFRAHKRIENLEEKFGTRVVNRLWELEIDTVGDLIETPAEFLLNQRGFGAKSLDRIQRVLCGKKV